MKIKERIIQISLVVMIGLSLFLTWKIWTNSGNQGIKEQSVATDTTANYKPAYEVFLPVKLIYHTQAGEHLYTNKESLIQMASREVSRFKIATLKAMTIADNDAFVALQSQANAVEFFYPSPVTINYFSKITHIQSLRSSEENFLFQRIIVNLAENQIYFILDANKPVYKAPFSGSISTLVNLLKAKDNRYKAMDLAGDFWPQAYLYQEPIRLKQYSYILATQSYTLFSKAFFTNTAEVNLNDTSKNNKDVQLTNNEGENLSISYNTGEVHFTGRTQHTVGGAQARTSLYEESYRYMQKIGPSLGTIRFFDKTHNQVIYRNYVEGFPIFGELNHGKVMIQLNNQLIQIDANQETIQVPIPSDEEITLPKTYEMLNQLLSAGISTSEISDFQIGYTWKNNETTKQVVDLSPEWYVKYQGKWVSSQVLLQAVATGEEGQLNGL